MTVVALDQVSAEHGGFYVPQFELLIDGDGLPDEVLHDVIEVTYTDNIDELDHFEITVGNWDAERLQCKYIGSETQEILDAGGPRAQPYKLFEPCAKTVDLSMGYSGRLRRLITATFTTMEPEFPADGPPTLKVRGLNVLHQLRRKKYNDAFENKRYSEIATTIGQREDDDLDAPRFPLAIVVNDEARTSEPQIRYVAQKMEFDVDFLWKLARERGYVMTILEETEEQPRRLYFGPSHLSGEPVEYRLQWGQSLMQFSPRLTTANQFRSVTVNGWNRDRQQPISETVTFDDPELNRVNPDLHELVMKCDPREELVVDEPVFTNEQAEDRARSLLLDQSKQRVLASGATVGLPGLRAGANIEIAGLGTRLSGTYFVTETRHVINDRGYLTNFKARREQRDSNGGNA